MAILCCVAQKAASAAQRRQNLGVDKILALTKSWRRQNVAQMQKNPLTVWLGRVHSCWLLPDLAEDILRFPDGVALFPCSRQVWRCLWPPCFYWRTFSRTVPAYSTGLPCWKRHKFWHRQNIGLKFTDFRQTTAVCISAHRCPIKKWWKQKVITITVQCQFLYSQPPNRHYMHGTVEQSLLLSSMGLNKPKNHFTLLSLKK